MVATEFSVLAQHFELALVLYSTKIVFQDPEVTVGVQIFMHRQIWPDRVQDSGIFDQLVFVELRKGTNVIFQKLIDALASTLISRLTWLSATERYESVLLVIAWEARLQDLLDLEHFLIVVCP